ncbi:MAG: RNA methyltransferase [Bdellovibrionales bacterium]|nr:RNA methyltransferase [Bdellovibrionales bacterium]
MPRFLGLTSRGLTEQLANELQDIGIKKVRARPDAVDIDCSWADLYRAHVHSRIATRFLLPVADFIAYNEDDLYNGVFKKHDFTKNITPQQTLRVEAHVREHMKLRDQRFVALKVKDAVVDQFWKKFDQRPNVGDEDVADLRIVVRVVQTQVSVSIDVTGDSLSNRGYRQHVGLAPLRENVAAGLLRSAGWVAPRPLVDPFCGSGTILIEAALTAAGLPMSKRRRPFAFEKLAGFQAEAWAEASKRGARKAPPAKPFLFGYDKDAGMIEKARANARAAGVENWILFQQRDVRELKAPAGCENGMIITNPPYGERMGELEQVKNLMNDTSATLKNSFKGWDAWILSGNAEASAALRLKAARRVPVWNGPIECRLLHYPLR